MGRGRSGGRVLGAALGLGAACFNPTGVTDLTTGISGSSSSSSSLTSGATTSGLTTGGTTGTTTGACGRCSSPTPFCLPNGQCGSCEALPDHGMSCAEMSPATPACDPDSGGCVECVGDEDCGDRACDPDSHTCVECVNDDHCGEATVCDEDAKACVGCVGAEDCTDPKQPICDAASQSCRPCREHRDCPTTACELDVGSCFPNDSTQTQPLYVDAKAPNCALGTCEVGMPCCELATALAAAGLQPKPYVVIRVAAGMGVAPAVLAANGKRVAVLADAKFALTVATNTAVITFGDVNQPEVMDSKLFLSGVKIVGGSSAAAVACWNATGLWFDEVEVRDHVGPSLLVAGCPSQARRSRFTGNRQGLYVDESTVGFENTIIAGITLPPTLHFVNSSVMSMRYTTLGEPVAVIDYMLSCDATSTLSIRNSVLVSSGAINPNACVPMVQTVVHTASTSSLLAGSGDNTMITLDDAVPLFESWMTHDLRLIEAGLLADLARWEAAIDPPVDFEGAPRPSQNGSADVAGADLPGPPPADR